MHTLIFIVQYKIMPSENRGHHFFKGVIIHRRYAESTYFFFGAPQALQPPQEEQSPPQELLPDFLSLTRLLMISATIKTRTAIIIIVK